MKHTRWFALVLMFALCVTSLPEAVAGSLAQGGEPLTFHKPAWGLSFTYPFEWTLRADEETFAAFVYEDTDDGAVFVIARDRKWGNPEYSLESIFNDIIAEVGATVEGPVIEPTGRLRTLAGAPTRLARFTAFDPDSEHELSGYVLAFATQGSAYGVVAGSFSETWSMHRSDVDRALRSIRFDVPPTREPEPTEEAIATEEPLPTEEAAPTPRTTPHAASTYLSAREAVDVALPAAQEWKPTATLFEMRCYNEGNADGGCRNWKITFAPGTDESSEAYSAWVVDGQVNPVLSSRDPLHDRALPPKGWVDSNEAMTTFLDNGGAGFLERHPQVKINLTLREKYTSPDFIWDIEAIDGDWSGPGATWSMEIDPTLNVVDTRSRTQKQATKYYTAQEAAKVAQRSMSKYPDAKTTEIFGSVQASEPGYDAARCSYWVFYYHWDETKQSAGRVDIEHVGYSLTLSDGKVKDADYTSYHHDPEVTGGWGDSPEALAAFQATADYQAFAELFADPVWSFVLYGDEKHGHLWKVSAELNGLKLEERFTLPAP